MAGLIGSASILGISGRGDTEVPPESTPDNGKHLIAYQYFLYRVRVLEIPECLKHFGYLAYIQMNQPYGPGKTCKYTLKCLYLTWEKVFEPCL